MVATAHDAGEGATMRFRLGLVLGFGAGYVLGAKAGTERYEQIRQLWGSVSGSEPAQQLGAEVRSAASRAGEVLEQKAGEGFERVTELVGEDGSGQDANAPLRGL
jgi:hypothetical protein